MGEHKYRSLLISDFNADNLAGYIRNDNHFPAMDALAAPFGQVVSVLMQQNLECWRTNPDLAVVWTQPETIVESFLQVLAYGDFSMDAIFDEVDRYSSLLAGIHERVKLVLVPTWLCPAQCRGLGMLDMRTGMGIANTLMRMNLRLVENLEKISNLFVLDSQRWMNIAGKDAFNPKLWYMGKIPFGNQVFKEATMDIKAAFRGIIGDTRKLIILDLDDTLWGGIVGDIGWKNLRLGGHDHIGESYADFQRVLKSLTNRGILLGIVSKNEETIALEAIKSHPEMVLRLDDFAGWKINWNDKAQNVVDLVSDLNLGLQSVVFIDDNPVERARVREALPEVLVPELPVNKMLYSSALLSLHCFDTPSISREDLERAAMYVAERGRKESQRQVGSPDEWLRSLGTVAKAEGLNEVNLQRTVQLLNKTNQMNLRTRRMSASELLKWAAEGNHRLWTFRVSDKFGDSGLTGIVSLEVNDKIGTIEDFVLSCRVMLRKLEETMLHVVVDYAQSIGLKEIRAEYLPTPKNRPCVSFLENSGFKCKGGNIFSWKVNKSYAMPPHVELENDSRG